VRNWVGIAPAVVSAIHDEQIAELRGAPGFAIPELWKAPCRGHKPSRLMAHPTCACSCRPTPLASPENQPFVDGNKHSALVLCELFLELNGCQNRASDAETLAPMLDLAASELDEDGFAAWLRDGYVPV